MSAVRAFGSSRLARLSRSATLRVFVAAMSMVSPLMPVATASAARPDPRPIPADPNVLTDEMIGKSIKRGAVWLQQQVDPQTHVLSVAAQNNVTRAQPIPRGAIPGDAMSTGANALAVYALMQAGLALKDEPNLAIRGPGVKAMVEAMCKQTINTGHPQTYARGIRATALSLYIINRVMPAPKPGVKAPPDVEKNTLLEDTSWLLRASKAGAYTYEMPPDAPKDDRTLMQQYAQVKPNNMKRAEMPWDASNSQYGLLGVWSAAEAEIEIPTAYWALVDNHWTVNQEAAGTWNYGPPLMADDKLAMTCAGLASLLVTHEYLEPAVLGGRVGREAFSPAVAKGLNWFETGDNSMKIGQFSNWWAYTLYGVERVGLASGFKHFGNHDWYKELSALIMSTQQPDGSWFGDPVSTSYCLLFLSRGRHPVMMNKLRYDGYWANRPRDASNMAVYGGKALERPLNWQVVKTTVDWQEWTDSPVLMLSGHVAPKLSKDELDRIRNYVYAGGVLFTQADGDSATFDKYAGQLARDLFGLELVAVPPTHPLFTNESLYNLKPPPTGLKMVSNGARILMLHAPKDVTRWWQTRDSKRHKIDFDLGVNLFIYAAGKRDLRNRIDSAWVPEPKASPSTTVKIAKLQYAGGWDPEPGAWKRYANWFQKQTGYKLDVNTVKMAELKPDDAQVAVLTGAVKQNFTAAESAALKAYVEAGGVVLADMTGGAGPFDQSIGELMKAAFGKSGDAVPLSHPMMTNSAIGMEDLTKRRLRQTAVQRVGQTGLPLQSLPAGKGHFVYSPMDITSGLLGTDTAGIIGYDSKYSEALVKNIIFWSMDGQPDKSNAAATIKPDADAK